MLRQKSNTLFRSCIPDINSISIPLYNLLEYCHNFSIASGSLWNYCRSKIDNVDVNDRASDGKSLEYKTKIVGKNRNATRSWKSRKDRPTSTTIGPSFNVEVTVLLKCLRANFGGLLIYLWWAVKLERRIVERKLIELIEIDRKHHNKMTGVDFMIASTTCYVPVVTLFINDNIKFLENLKQRFKRAMKQI